MTQPQPGLLIRPALRLQRHRLGSPRGHDPAKSDRGTDLDKYRGKIDTSDAKDPEMALRTRGLAAWSVEELSGCTEAEAAASVVDDFGDNGVDAIHIDAPNSTVYLVQSKWSVNGTGSAATGDIHKFVKGLGLLHG
jgi:hypothetical protein